MLEHELDKVLEPVLVSANKCCTKCFAEGSAEVPEERPQETHLSEVQVVAAGNRRAALLCAAVVAPCLLCVGLGWPQW